MTLRFDLVLWLKKSRICVFVCDLENIGFDWCKCQNLALYFFTSILIDFNLIYLAFNCILIASWICTWWIYFDSSVVYVNETLSLCVWCFTCLGFYSCILHLDLIACDITCLGLFVPYNVLITCSMLYWLFASFAFTWSH